MCVGRRSAQAVRAGGRYQEVGRPSWNSHASKRPSSCLPLTRSAVAMNSSVVTFE